MIHENSDGTILVTLEQPVKIGNDTQARVMFRPVTVGAVRAAGAHDSEDRDALQFAIDMALAVADPPAAFEAVTCARDMHECIEAGARQWGKFHRVSTHGEPPSALSGPASPSTPSSSTA